MGAGRSLRFRPGARTPRPPRPRIAPPQTRIRSVQAWHEACETLVRHKRCYMTIPPRLRHPLRRTPGRRVPAASRHARQAIRRPGVLHITSSCAQRGGRLSCLLRLPPNSPGGADRWVLHVRPEFWVGQQSRQPSLASFSPGLHSAAWACSQAGAQQGPVRLGLASMGVSVSSGKHNQTQPQGNPLALSPGRHCFSSELFELISI